MSKIYNFKIKGDIFKLRYFFLDNYPNSTLLYLMGDWFRVYNNDAVIINHVMNYKIFEDKTWPYENKICCGFPEYVLDKVEYNLDKNKINYIVVDLLNNEYKFHDYEEENNYLEYLNKEDLPIIKEEKRVDSNEYVEVGDSVTIENLKNNNIEEYTIIQAYYGAKPVGVNRGPFSFGTIKYKDELINESDVDNGQILSDAPFAQVLLGLSKGDIFITKDENAEDSEYRLISLRKGKKY